MALFDKGRLVGEMAARYGIHLDDRDPALAMIGLNQLALEESIQVLSGQLRARISEFEMAAEKVEARVGTVLAKQVRESVAEIRRQLHRDIHAAGLRSRELVEQVHKAHRRPVLIRWGVIGMLIGCALFSCGVWVGRMTALGWARAGF